MAPASSHSRPSSSFSSPSSSPFPSTPVALSRPHHAAVRSSNYDNYNQAFSEDTSYSSRSHDAGAVSPAAAAAAPRPTAPAALGKVVATACSLSRKASFHTRAKTLASFVPSLNPSDTEEQEGATRSLRRGLTLGDIFNQRRPSVAPTEDDDESEFIMSYKPSFTGGARGQPEPQPQRQQPAKPTGIRSFTWFGAKTATPASPPLAPADSTVDVDLLGSATSLLFPTGSPDSASPEAFKELVQNAEFIITRLQNAYKEQASALHLARAEREAQAEEAEEAATRARHLKLQLDDVSSRVADQVAANRALAEELAAAKLRHHEDCEQFERIARQNDMTPRRSRHSGASSLASDSGFESEADTASSCSRPITPTSPNLHSYALSNDRWGSLMEPIKEARPVSRDSHTARIPGRTCEVDSGVWTYMREEKTRLERRVQELEGALDGCLDIIA